MWKYEKPSRWYRFKEWCYYNDFWQKVCEAIVFIAIIGGFILLISWAAEPESGDLITEGVIIDMGRYTPGRYARQYACWIKIQSNDGIVGTWDVSDTVYETMSIGDWVEKKEVKP